MRVARWFPPIGIGTILMLLACVGRGEVRGATAQSSPVQVKPVDEASEDSVFSAYRSALRTAVRDRDVAALLTAVAPDLRSRLAEWLDPKRALHGGEKEDWRELEQLLALGGTFTATRGAVKGRREFCAPYVYSAYPWPVPSGYGSEVDPSVLLEADVAVHAAPSSTSPVLTRLSYALVQEVGGGYPGDGRPGPTWTLVILQDDREGYVLDTQIRSPTDYHACFAQIEGRWQMVRFARDITPTGPSR